MKCRPEAKIVWLMNLCCKVRQTASICLLVARRIREHNIEASRACMVGDRLNADMLFGKRGDMNTLMVLSGASTKADSDESTDKCRPQRVASSIATILKAEPGG